MNKNELKQIIFNALETERSATKSPEYQAKVEEAMRLIRNEPDTPRGVCKECGSMDIDKVRV
jgi:hypothetical protein